MGIYEFFLIVGVDVFLVGLLSFLLRPSEHTQDFGPIVRGVLFMSGVNLVVLLAAGWLASEHLADHKRLLGLVTVVGLYALDSWIVERFCHLTWPRAFLTTLVVWAANVGISFAL